MKKFRQDQINGNSKTIVESETIFLSPWRNSRYRLKYDIFRIRIRMRMWLRMRVWIWICPTSRIERAQAMAHHWQPIQRYTFIYNYHGEALNIGYCLQVWPRGHRYCECSRGVPSFFFRHHDPRCGAFPSHYLVTDFYRDQFYEAHPEFEGSDPSYGYWRPWLARTN